jgi:NAD(P)-dependent dehydrogenase (short-subunit alcohol dehydrogenase family)
MRLKDKVAIVTGIGAGIGEAIAIRFAEEGARQVLNDINEPNARATLEKVQKAGGEARLVVGDISKEETGQRLAQTAVESFGKLDILVNNAADFTQFSVEDAGVQDWQKVLGVNVIGTALVSKFATPYLKKQGGAIVNIASMSGFIAQPNFATYNSSKGAQIMMTKCMALDLAPWNIRVNAICPGCIVTSASFREIERLGLTFEQWRDQMAPLHLLNRLGDPVEVANAALFLGSDEASFITGTTLMVDGGYTAR